MRLTLIRKWLKDDYTIGNLYVDGVCFCNTLEDKCRDVNKNGIFDGDEKKVYGKTAIPYGTYDITIDVVSPKYSKRKAYDFCQGKLPRLLNVPHFEGILIHIGNHPEDTEGCILVGENKVKGALVNSTVTFKNLYAKLLTDKDNLTIEIA